jgi:multiple sugar transport system permease protein
MPESLNEPWKPLPTKAARQLRLAVTLFFLTLLLLFVQLPLIWMIVTALKQPGTAFKLEFLPKTQVVSEPIAVLPGGDDKTRVVFEFSDPRPTSVSVAGDFNGWNPEDPDTQLTSTVDGIWVGAFEHLPPGPIAYKFVTNGSTWIPDPSNSNVDGDGNAVLRVTEGQTVSNRPVTNASVLRGGTLEVALRLPEGQILRAIAGGTLDPETGETKGASTIDLAYSDGAYRGTVPGVTQPTFQVATVRSLGDAVTALYTFSNFMKILNSDDFPFYRYALNSLIVAGVAAFLTVVICTMAGYAFAVKPFHFREALFAGFLSSMLVPGMIYMVPQFSITLQLGWLNTYAGLIVPHLGNVFGLFLLRQYVGQIPKDLFNAAAIDGASEFRVFQNIVIPLCMPIMVTLFLLVFVSQWSNFLWQLIVTTPDSSVVTLPVGLQAFKGQYGTDWELIMAGACFSIIPIAILFVSAQKFFLEGLTAGAVKE